MSCDTCKYKRNIPGDAHVRCVFKWGDLQPPKADATGIRNGWYFFPLNFDPNWQIEECKAYEVSGT